jgi:hypothetical protein
LIKKLQDIASRNKDPSLSGRIKECVDIVTGLDAFVKHSCSDETEMQKMINEDTLHDPRTAGGYEMLSGQSVGKGEFLTNSHINKLKLCRHGKNAICSLRTIIEKFDSMFRSSVKNDS